MNMVISLIVVLLVAWLGIAYLLVIFKKSETYGDALTLVLNTFWEWGKFSTPSPIYALSDTQVLDLTNQLKPYFKYVVYQSGVYEVESIKVCYLAEDATIPIAVIEKIFENYIRRVFNLSAIDPLFLFAYMENGFLALMCGCSEKSKNFIQEQRNNRRSRELLRSQDLTD